MKEIEKANILALHDNMLTKDLPISSIMLKYKGDSSVQRTREYTGNESICFIKNLMKILDVQDKSELKGQTVSACTEFYQILAIGNESESQWIDLNAIDKIIQGNIIQYFEEKSKNINDGFER